MIKKIFITLCLLSLSNCAAPNTVFLGPIFTGAKTGSIYQASLSYSSTKIMNELKQSNIFTKPGPEVSNVNIWEKNPIINSTYAVVNIKISEVFEPEPLP